MGELFQEILNTLTVFPGSLVYHLVLGFTIAGAFQAAMNLWRESSFPQGRRMVIGLGLLLSVQLILFVGAGLAGKDVFDPHGLSPILDRTSTALGIIIIIWLWAFPEPQRSADAASGLLVLLTFTAAALSFVWWSENSAATFFNRTWLDTGWELYSLGLLGIGILTLLIRKPNSWGVGISMMTVLSVGHIFHLVAPLPGNDFAGVVRLAQMAGYPLLLALPHRFQAPTIVEPQAPQKLQPLFKERPQYSVSPQVFRSILAIGAQKSFPEICETMTRTIAEAMLADVCLALLPPNRDGQMNVQCGFDLIREKNIPGQLFDGKDIPLLLSAMERALPLRLPASSTSRDLFTLGTKLQLGRAGHLLAAFVSGNDKTPLVGIVLLSPYSNRGWSNEDQKFLLDITSGLAQILQRSRQWSSLQDKLLKGQQNMQSFQALLEETQKENAELKDELNELQAQDPQERAQNAAALAVSQAATLEKIERLQTENKRLEELVESLLTEKVDQETTTDKSEHLEEELRLTLQELARLKTQLSVFDQEMLALQSETTDSHHMSDNQIEVFTSIAQDLRQPMSSIVGYTDLLLGESIGILGALQRKFLERVKASTERMEVLLDDLFQITSIDGDHLELKPETVDLGNVIDEAILAASPQLRDRHIILRVDMPDKLPQVKADRDALGQVFIHLLKNAGDASPVEGEILLSTSTHATDDQQEYILVQVADEGGGIPTQDLPRVFSRLYRADNPLIEGVGDTGVGLSIAKTLVEAHQGRIWVDTEKGKGSTFSVLIPLTNGSIGDLSL